MALYTAIHPDGDIILVVAPSRRDAYAYASERFGAIDYGDTAKVDCGHIRLRAVSLYRFGDGRHELVVALGGSAHIMLTSSQTEAVLQRAEVDVVDAVPLPRGGEL